MIYYISDLHIGHKAALRFDERPFADVKEMENEIILRWNQKVTAEDDVYILGDVFYGYIFTDIKASRQIFCISSTVDCT